MPQWAGPDGSHPMLLVINLFLFLPRVAESPQWDGRDRRVPPLPACPRHMWRTPIGTIAPKLAIIDLPFHRTLPPFGPTRPPHANWLAG